MKTARMLLLAFCCAMLAGCTAPSGGTDALAVYSFCGETAQFSVTNGIIVLHPGKDILYGGTLTGKQDIPSKAAACSTAFFVLSEGGRHTLLSCESVDATGTGLDISGRWEVWPGKTYCTGSRLKPCKATSSLNWPSPMQAGRSSTAKCRSR